MMELNTQISARALVADRDEATRELNRGWLIWVDNVAASVSGAPAIPRLLHYPRGHSDRVALVAELVGRRLGLSREELVTIQLAGLAHDIGKSGVPNQILGKAGPLTPEERLIVAQHPLMGEQICAPLKLFHRALPIIRHHHERLDGSGYPDGLKGEQISMSVRIVSVADVYDSLTNTRSYRQPLSSQKALSLMYEEAKRGWWDSVIIETLDSCLTKAC